MSGWYERAEDELVRQVNDGEISEAAFRAEMRDIRDAIRQEAEEAAEAAYDDVMGRW